ncbi:helix-turn-helix domain-containing protein [Streptomyces sp. NBC_01353]|uniref:helix-turn-helix domain-containing protein n=1 Tax=Streptomyces sp. NBC_01353 TaxID=2903835 RepID=UPI002E32D502|nr:helix-turn-helix domain-containing protein [Streptomyces sp. NBC_01353]
MATEADGFAELVRGLKERSGLSYGALAKKLHVSTSTLHRYCNGDAVPAEFAPVERLGRLCGASRDELIALHRSWILADEARRRGKNAPAAPEPQGPAETAAGSSTVAAVETTAETTAATAPEGAPDAVSDAGSDAVSDAGSDTAVTPAAPEPAPELVAEPGAEYGPEPEVVVTVQAHPRPSDVPSASARSHSRKRLRTAVAAAAVVALAVPVAYAVGLPDEKGAGDAKASGQHADGSVEPPAASVSAPVTASASTSGSGSPSAATTPSASATASRAKPSARATRQAAGDPVSVGISSYNWAGACGQYYALGQPPGQVPPPPAPQDSRGWARALGGVDGGHMQLQLTATGRTEEATVLTAVRVRVVERAAPLDRAAYFMGDGCGGGITPQAFDIDLDAPHPTAKPVAGLDGEHRVPAKDFPYKVSTSDPQVLNLDVHTESYVVSWYLEVEWSSGERHGKARVDDGGKPFRTSAIEGKKEYTYRPEKGEWAAPQ